MRRAAAALLASALVAASLALAGLPAHAAPDDHLVGTFSFVDGNGDTQQLALDITAAGPPTYAGTGTVQWIAGLHPGIYTDIVKVDVDTTTQPGSTIVSVVFTIAGEEWAIVVTTPGSGPAHAKLYDLGAFPALVAEGDVSAGGVQVEGGLPTLVEPTVTSFSPVLVAPGGTVTFAGTCGSRPAPQAFTVNLMNVGNQGFYAGQSSIGFSFPPGTNTGADTPFSGTFTVPTGAIGYPLWFVVTCYWPAADYVDNTQGNGWFAATAEIHSVYVTPKLVLKPWWSKLGLLAHSGLGSLAAPTALQIAAFGAGFGPPPTTTTTSTPPTTRPRTTVPRTAPETVPPTVPPTEPPTTTTTTQCRDVTGAPVPCR